MSTRDFLWHLAAYPSLGHTLGWLLPEQAAMLYVVWICFVGWVQSDPEPWEPCLRPTLGQGALLAIAQIAGFWILLWRVRVPL